MQPWGGYEQKMKKSRFFAQFFLEFFLLFPELPARTFLEAIKKWQFYIFDGISKLCLRFSLGPHLHLFWKNLKNAFFSGRLKANFRILREIPYLYHGVRARNILEDKRVWILLYFWRQFDIDHQIVPRTLFSPFLRK